MEAKMFNSKLRGQTPLNKTSCLTGQATVEYLVIFAVLALLTLLSLSTFYPRMQSIGEDLFQAATERILAE